MGTVSHCSSDNRDKQQVEYKPDAPQPATDQLAGRPSVSGTAVHSQFARG